MFLSTISIFATENELAVKKTAKNYSPQ